jgi:hypothetical protein
MTNYIYLNSHVEISSPCSLGSPSGDGNGKLFLRLVIVIEKRLCYKMEIKLL